MTTIERFKKGFLSVLLEENCNKFEMKQREYNIRKRIAKHGENAIIVIPKLLKDELKPSTIVELNIKVIEEAEENE